MNKPGLKFTNSENSMNAVQFYEVSAAFELRKAALHWEETTVAAWKDAEEAGWTKEAADMFFSRAHHPYFISDAFKSARKRRHMAEVVQSAANERFGSSDIPDGIQADSGQNPAWPDPDKDGIYKDAHDTFGTRRGVVFEKCDTDHDEDPHPIHRRPDHDQITD